MQKYIQNVFCYCDIGRSLLLDNEAGNIVSVRGVPGHPANSGRLCPKGVMLTVLPAPRLLVPELSLEHQVSQQRAVPAARPRIRSPGKRIPEEGAKSVVWPPYFRRTVTRPIPSDEPKPLTALQNKLKYGIFGGSCVHTLQQKLTGPLAWVVAA
jgi:Molybdopterin oxidoreductase Fe4S4 domain